MTAEMQALSTIHPNQIVKGNRPPEKGRGVKNSGGSPGSAESRRRRRAWLLETYRANVDVRTRPMTVVKVDVFAGTEEPTTVSVTEEVPLGEGIPACRCYRCGILLTVQTMTVDRIVPGCKKTVEYPRGGTYVRKNIRPACAPCNSETGGALASRGKK